MDRTRHIKFYNYIETHLLSILLIVFYTTEGFSKYTMLYYDERPIITKIIKLVVIIFIMIHLIKNYKLITQLLIISFGFVLGQLFINPNFDYLVIGVFIKYLFPLLLFTYFNQKSLSIKTSDILQRIFEIIILTNGFFIIIGYVFNIQLFETYAGSRFGFNGLFVTSASGTYAYLVALFYFLFKYKEKFIFKFKSITVILSCLFIGTKALYLTLGLILVFYFLFYTHKKQRVVGVTIMSIILISGVYYALFVWDVFISIWLKEGFWTSVLSYRNKLFSEKTIPFIKSNWSWINYLFGGVNSISTRSQMGLIDLFYFFGIIGSVFYVRSYILNFVKFKLKNESLLFLLLLCAVIFISGNFFLNASVVVYMLIVKESIIRFNEANFIVSKSKD